MNLKRKRTVAIGAGSACFSAAFILPSALSPWTELSPELVMGGIAVPTGVGFVLLMVIRLIEDGDAKAGREVAAANRAQERLKAEQARRGVREDLVA